METKRLSESCKEALRYYIRTGSYTNGGIMDMLTLELYEYQCWRDVLGNPDDHILYEDSREFTYNMRMLFQEHLNYKDANKFLLAVYEYLLTQRGI